MGNGYRFMQTTKIKITQFTACETVEGRIIQADAGSEHELPTRAANYLIALGKAELIPPPIEGTAVAQASAAPTPASKKT